ncbi:hypothetical protein RHP75_09115 [Pseudomonas sp. SG20056]|uniref:hypothetical protein n=1 Tax=Pseudomonas sp. SG20056 TaxID=3074146 RepID=UPI00287F56E1|nr:hypothetical protein [Pseudomonas sp. SG20056]WNF48549.1 hypothetical protein RHP75_09115 [Pseudomonas sp. SG20056]
MHSFRSKFKIASLAAVLLLSGCAQTPVTNIEPISPETIDPIKSKILGRYALIVESENMRGIYHSTSTACALYDFPYDVSEPYTKLIHETLKASLQSVELVGTTNNFNPENYDAVILVTTTSMKTKFNIKKRIFTTDAIAFSSIISNIKITLENKKQIHEEFNATRNYTGPLGYVCSKVPEAMKTSIEHSSHETAIAILKLVRATLWENISSESPSL